MEKPKDVQSFLLDTEVNKYVINHSYKPFKDLITYPEQACNLPLLYKKMQDEILNLEVLPDDVWLITYPKCGTTWTQEMVWMIVNNLDYEGANVDIFKRFPFLEVCSLDENLWRILNIPENDLLQPVKDMKPPRLIKTHLPVGLLPRQLWNVNPKIIYLMREPKDVAVSYLNHYMIFHGYSGSKERFFEAFTSDNVLMGSYWKHVQQFWKIRQRPNVLINTFEDMKKDLLSVIRRTAEFFGKEPLLSNEMDKLVDHLKFSNMKNNDFVNLKSLADEMKNIHGVAKDHHFINKGEVGSYKAKMSPEWIKRFDDWNQEEKIKYGVTDKDFPY